LTAWSPPPSPVERHLTSPLNIIASDMIRDKALPKKLDADPRYFGKTYVLDDMPG
jgi:hypothetical protein